MSDERDVARQKVLEQTPYRNWKQLKNAIRRYREDDEPEAR